MSETWRGFWIAIAINLLALSIYFLALWLLSSRTWFNTPYEALWKNTRNLFTYLFWGIGFSQVLHIVPIAFWLRQHRRFERMKGVLMGAAFTALFCGSCFIIVFPSFSNYFIFR